MIISWASLIVSAALVIVIMIMVAHKMHDMGYADGFHDGEMNAKRKAKAEESHDESITD